MCEITEINKIKSLYQLLPLCISIPNPIPTLQVLAVSIVAAAQTNQGCTHLNQAKVGLIKWTTKKGKGQPKNHKEKTPPSNRVAVQHLCLTHHPTKHSNLWNSVLIVRFSCFVFFPQAFGAQATLKYVIKTISLDVLTPYMQFIYNLRVQDLMQILLWKDSPGCILLR